MSQNATLGTYLTSSDVNRASNSQGQGNSGDVKPSFLQDAKTYGNYLNKT